MTENIFENGGEFCMRGDPEHKPVEWHWFRGAKDRQVVFVDSRNDIRACFADGRYWPEGQHNLDLIPVRRLRRRW